MAGQLDHVGDSGFRSRLHRVDLESNHTPNDVVVGNPAASGHWIVHGDAGVRVGYADREPGVR